MIATQGKFALEAAPCRAHILLFKMRRGAHAMIMLVFFVVCLSGLIDLFAPTGASDDVEDVVVLCARCAMEPITFGPWRNVYINWPYWPGSDGMKTRSRCGL